MGSSPKPSEVQSAVPEIPQPTENNEAVFEAQMPLTPSGKEVSKVKWIDYGGEVRVVFDAETGETLGVLKI